MLLEQIELQIYEHKVVSMHASKQEEVKQPYVAPRIGSKAVLQFKSMTFKREADVVTDNQMLIQRGTL